MTFNEQEIKILCAILQGITSNPSMAAGIPDNTDFLHECLADYAVNLTNWVTHTIKSTENVTKLEEKK